MSWVFFVFFLQLVVVDTDERKQGRSPYSVVAQQTDEEDAQGWPNILG